MLIIFKLPWNKNQNKKKYYKSSNFSQEQYCSIAFINEYCLKYSQLGQIVQVIVERKTFFYYTPKRGKITRKWPIFSFFSNFLLQNLLMTIYSGCVGLVKIFCPSKQKVLANLWENRKNFIKNIFYLQDF